MVTAEATTPDEPQDLPTIEEMTNAQLLASVEESLLRANLYLDPMANDNGIALADVIDALDNMLVVVKRLATEVQP